MVDIHEVFSTSITLDEVERANRCASGECPTDDQTVTPLFHLAQFCAPSMPAHKMAQAIAASVIAASTLCA